MQYECFRLNRHGVRQSHSISASIPHIYLLARLTGGQSNDIVKGRP